MSTLPPPHPTYTPPQLARFLNHIHLPRSSQSLRPSHPALASPAEKLHFLTQLQRLTLAAVPFENLSIHYTTNPETSIDPDFLFEKIVGQGRGRGGEGLENNTFFGTVLRSLGFEVYAVGARVCDGGGVGGGAGKWKGKGKEREKERGMADGKGEREGEGEGAVYLGWSHMVLIVTIAAQRYMVDVGFGRSGPTLPLLLENNAQEDAIAPGARVRLVKESLPQSLHPSDNAQKLWIYQQRGPSNKTHHHHPSLAGLEGEEERMEERENWIPMYAFTELEFFPQDFEVMKFWVSRVRTSFFTYTVVVMKYLVERDEEGGAVCVGTVQMLGGQVKRTIGGKSEVIKECRTEGERVKVLEDVFGIRLSERERRGIVRTVAELRGVAS